MRRLVIKLNPRVSDADPAKYHTHIRLDDGTEPRFIFSGFSYFGEIGGLRHIPTEKHIVLYPDRNGDDWKRVLHWNSPEEHIRITDRAWLKFLADHHVNLVRVWLFDLVEADSYVFWHHFGQSRYDLQKASSRYLRRLCRFIDIARIYGIVVHLTLSSDQMVRNDAWPIYPFHPAHSINDFFTTDPVSFLDLPAGTTRESIEREMIRSVTTAVKPYWNVMFEVMNEAGIVDGRAAKEGEWAKKVKGWLAEDLRDVQGNRTHLITLSGNHAGHASIFTDVAPDIISLHGSQWGGNDGKNQTDPQDDATILGLTRKNINDLYSNFSFPFAVICDSDSFPRAQDDPQRYARLALSLQLNYAHRYHERFLGMSLLYSQVNGLAASTGGLPFYGGISPSPAPIPSVAYDEAEVAGTWVLRGGVAARDIGSFRRESIWVISNTPTGGGYTIYHWNPQTSTWEQVDGGAVRVAVGPDGMPWVVNNNHNIYHRTTAGWQLIAGGANDIGVGGDGTVWVIGTTPVPGGYNIQRRDGNVWTTVDGGAVRISVSPNGEPWVVNDQGAIFARDADKWIQTPGSAKDIGCALDDTTWIIGTNPVPGGFGVYYWTGTYWRDVDTRGGVAIAADHDGLPWIADEAFNVYQRFVIE